MVRGVLIAIIVGVAIAGLYYTGALQLGQKTVQEELPRALDQIQNGLTYDKFVNMVDSQRDSLVQKMPQKTIDLILEEARKLPTTVSESIQDMASKLGSDSQSIIYSKQGSFVGLKGNNAKGKAIIISAGKVAFLRFQDFEVTNGPDLHVYMTSGDNISDRKSTRLNSSHDQISYAVFCLKKKIDDSDTHRTLLSSLTACLHN